MTFTLTESPDERRDRISKAIDFAGRYARSFDVKLLQHWYTAIVEHTLAPNATHAELAADNALRAFVVGIIRQYQLATTGSPDTPWQPIQPPPATQQPMRARTRKPRSSRKTS